MFFKFLTWNYPLRKYYFYMAKFCLQLIGFWPQTPRTRLNSLWACVNFLILLVGVSTEMHAGVTTLKYNLEKGLDTLCPAGTSAVTLLKMFLISYYRQDLQYVLKRLQAMLFEENVHRSNALASKNKIIRTFSVLAARLNFAPFLTGFITCTAYNFKPLVVAWIFWYQGKEVQWQTPFNMTQEHLSFFTPQKHYSFPFSFLLECLQLCCRLPFFLSHTFLPLIRAT